jgi:phosphate acetyltransferase
MKFNTATGTILFCEPDARIIQAAHTLKKEGKITPILIGDAQAYHQAAANETLLEGIEILPVNASLYAKKYFEKRKHKGISIEQAHTECQHPATFATMHLLNTNADALVCGATWPTSETLRPALRLLAKDLASSYFLMDTEHGEYLFADCALNVQPTAEQLSQIAINTAQAANKLGKQPKIAMLSFSTIGSAQHPDQEKVRKATQLVHTHIEEEGLDWMVSGEIQVDAAMNKTVAQHKAPKESLKGDANIFVFPDLDAANIGYKLVQRFTGCDAVGPIITGLAKEVNDLSRGCTAEEIVQVAQLSVWNATQ